MGKIEVTIQISTRSEREPGAPKAKLPRKLKKDIIKVAGRTAYREMIAKMQQYYNAFGYRKFNIKRTKV